MIINIETKPKSNRTEDSNSPMQKCGTLSSGCNAITAIYFIKIEIGRSMGALSSFQSPCSSCLLLQCADDRCRQQDIRNSHTENKTIYRKLVNTQRLDLLLNLYFLQYIYNIFLGRSRFTYTFSASKWCLKRMVATQFQTLPVKSFFFLVPPCAIVAPISIQYLSN